MRRLILFVLAVTAAASIELLSGGTDGHDGHTGNDGSFPQIRAVLAQATSFLFTFDGQPTAPQQFRPSDWDVVVNVFDDFQGNGQMNLMQAQHGADCSAPPATHSITSITQAVFMCNDHIMTAMSSGYGAIYLTPNQQVDFSTGEAVIRFDLSTFQMVLRDWVDLWITPFDENLVLPLQRWLPAYNGEPRRSVHAQLYTDPGGTKFHVETVRDFAVDDLPRAEWRGYEQVLTPSATRRDTFEMRISRTHVRFGMPAYNLWWVDTPMTDLGWGRGVVQFGHHAYNPTKGCDETHGGADPNGQCVDTWHWDNVSIAPAVPFTIIRGAPHAAQVASPQITFPTPAPQNAFLRFAAVGQNIQASFNGGAWQTATLQAQNLKGLGAFASYWMPIPAGTTSVRFTGETYMYVPWGAQDASIWSATPSAPPQPTPTPVPPASCVTRPKVTVSSVKTAPGTLQVTLTAGTTSLVPSNGFRELRVGAASNALVDAGGQVGRAGSFSVPLSSVPQQYTFTVRRATAGIATTVPFVIVDGCGDWSTFVGGGPNAF